MDFNFILDENYLSLFILNREMFNESEDIKLIKTSLKDNIGYQKIINDSLFNPEYLLLDNDVNKVINDFKNTNAFKKLYNETKEYCNTLKNYWNENKNNINNYLKNILKTNINIKPNVYISHPCANRGYSFSNNNVAWGHIKGVYDLNYNIVYLVHEGLHCLIPFEQNDNKDMCNIKHSIIELIADYELNSKLKGKSTLDEGHPYLSEYKKVIYPYWLKYINLNNNQIDERLKLDNISDNVFNNTDNIDVSNINIYDFINICYEIYNKKNIKNSNK